jgi:hypothetical protein
VEGEEEERQLEWDSPPGHLLLTSAMENAGCETLVAPVNSWKLRITVLWEGQKEEPYGAQWTQTWTGTQELW